VLLNLEPIDNLKNKFPALKFTSCCGVFRYIMVEDLEKAFRSNDQSFVCPDSSSEVGVATRLAACHPNC